MDNKDNQEQVRRNKETLGRIETFERLIMRTY